MSSNKIEPSKTMSRRSRCRSDRGLGMGKKAREISKFNLFGGFSAIRETGAGKEHAVSLGQIHKSLLASVESDSIRLRPLFEPGSAGAARATSPGFKSTL